VSCKEVSISQWFACVNVRILQGRFICALIFGGGGGTKFRPASRNSASSVLLCKIRDVNANRIFIFRHFHKIVKSD